MTRIGWKKVGAGIAGFATGAILVFGGIYSLNRNLHSRDSQGANLSSIDFGVKDCQIHESLVDTDQYKIRKSGILFSGGLTSCSIVCLYCENDKKEKVGAMAHFPRSFPGEAMESKVKFRQILEDMVSMGGKRKKVESASLRYATGTDNSSEYLLRALKREGVRNTDLCTYSNEILGAEFNISGGRLEIHRSASQPVEIYRF